jgi:hypothetical protein
LDRKITIGTRRKNPRKKTGEAGGRPFFPLHHGTGGGA